MGYGVYSGLDNGDTTTCILPGVFCKTQFLSVGEGGSGRSDGDESTRATIQEQ